MPVPFGVSVEDFIVGIEVLIDAIKSLSDTHGAQADYKEFGRELNSLKTALGCVQNLSLDPSQPTHASAVNAAVNDCILCVDTFVKRNSKYASLETPRGKAWSLAGLKNGRRMVQWAILKKKDVAKFRAQVQQHADAIQMLLAILQVNQSSAQGRRQAAYAQQSADHTMLTKDIRKNVSDIDVEQQRVKRTLDYQHKIVNNTSSNVRTIIDKQSSLAHSMTTQYM